MQALAHHCSEEFSPMTPSSVASPRDLSGPHPVLPSAVFGMLIFVVAELMLFAGLMSAFSIVKSGALGWPPPGQPRLPVEATLFNSAVLLASAVVLFFANRSFARDRDLAKRPLAFALGLGAFFVVFQGYEWVMLIRQGLRLTSSNHGSFFFLIVGLHGLHAIAGLAVLARAGFRLSKGLLAPDTFAAAQVFWYFVVGLWPVLYFMVYL
jgi:heme/copper-type cytochrome/quinol oxidase subunit 3